MRGVTGSSGDTVWRALSVRLTEADYALVEELKQQGNADSIAQMVQFLVEDQLDEIFGEFRERQAVIRAQVRTCGLCGKPMDAKTKGNVKYHRTECSVEARRLMYFRQRQIAFAYRRARGVGAPASSLVRRRARIDEGPPHADDLLRYHHAEQERERARQERQRAAAPEAGSSPTPPEPGP